MNVQVTHSLSFLKSRALELKRGSTVNSDYYSTKCITQRACLITCMFYILLFSPTF